MSADELRKAAETLRGLAEGVTRHSGGKDLWFDADIDLRNAIRGTFIGNEKSAPDDARWIALMSPGVGKALAKWLDDIAAGWMWDGEEPGVVDFDGDRLTFEDSMDTHALTVARLINGEPA